MKTSSLRKAIIMEINLISAQDLTSSTSRPSSKPMQTYVVAYIDPMEKAVSRVDRTGNRNPTWNDKKDKKIGVVHVLLEDLLKINGRNCMAFLIRNPSGEPRGIMNLGAATLNGMFHEDLPKFLSSKVAIDHRKLMGRG
ncbi:INGRESSION PROTEIN FIC1 [Salix purpurea]|uniref:INGRESSION PROTEIN FIC1 n=1 Tax=Salix purpurea TaxID=77065 RepID=A0A9Q1AGS6_SALPP|nr:INGRESSION PROTEIN FIC1 [Salix purpurea]